MAAIFISFLAVLIVVALFGDSDVNPAVLSRRRSQSFGLIPAFSVSVLIWTSAVGLASQQTSTPDPPEKPDTQVSSSPTGSISFSTQKGEAVGAIEVIVTTDGKSDSVISTVKTAAGDIEPPAATATETDPSDIFFVITKEGLNKLIAASGGDVSTFDVETLKQASAFMPLSLSQSRALSPVLRTAASPVMLRRLFNPANLKAIQGFLESSDARKSPESPPIDHAAWDQFLVENSWIEKPGIGQVVTKTGFVEEGRSEEIAKEVQTAIRIAVAERIQNLAREKYGVPKLDTSRMDLSVFDPSQVIAQTARWEEQVYQNGDSDNVMVRTHVLVDLPKQEIATLMAGVKTELQHKRLVAIGITVGLFWFGIALSSIAFRTYHSKSRVWKMIVIPLLSLAVIPCLIGAGLMIGEMATGNVF